MDTEKYDILTTYHEFQNFPVRVTLPSYNDALTALSELTNRMRSQEYGTDLIVNLSDDFSLVSVYKKRFQDDLFFTMQIIPTAQENAVLAPYFRDLRGDVECVVKRMKKDKRSVVYLCRQQLSQRLGRYQFSWFYGYLGNDYSAGKFVDKTIEQSCSLYMMRINTDVLWGGKKRITTDRMLWKNIKYYGSSNQIEILEILTLDQLEEQRKVMPEFYEVLI